MINLEELHPNHMWAFCDGLGSGLLIALYVAIPYVKHLKSKHRTEKYDADQEGFSNGYKAGWRTGRASLLAYIDQEHYEKVNGKPFTIK